VENFRRFEEILSLSISAIGVSLLLHRPTRGLSFVEKFIWIANVDVGLQSVHI
jgi:hypothetical protein